MASEMHNDLVRSVALSDDFVLSGSYDQSIKVLFLLFRCMLIGHLLIR